MSFRLSLRLKHVHVFIKEIQLYITLRTSSSIGAKLTVQHYQFWKILFIHVLINMIFACSIKTWKKKALGQYASSGASYRQNSMGEWTLYLLICYHSYN